MHTWLAVAAASLPLALPARIPAARLALVILAGLGVALAAVAGGDPVQAEVVTVYPAFVGQEIQAREFPVETVTGAGYLAPLLVAAFALLCARLAPTLARPRMRLLSPVLLALLATALALLLEKAAAPRPVTAAGMHRACWLPALFAAWRIGHEAGNVLRYVLAMAVVVTAQRLPAAIFGTLATRGHWGTSLDVHGVTFCVHPIARTPLELAPGSQDQLWHLLWWPELIVFPALTLLSAGGLGFLAYMLRRAPPAATR